MNQINNINSLGPTYLIIVSAVSVVILIIYIIAWWRIFSKQATARR